jgi:CelD/BcsL family acetyltransferase involved in cellulose biosynthesis
MENVEIKTISDVKELESLAPIWDSLLQQCQEDSSVYLTHEWLMTWWKYFGEGKELNVILLEKEQKVIGIVPLMKTMYKIGSIKLYVLETIGSNNCNYVWLVPSESRQDVISALLVYLGEEFSKAKLVLWLSFVPGGSKFLEMLRRHYSHTNNLYIKEQIQTVAPYLSLPETWDEYFRSLGSRRRKVLRRLLRSLEQAHSINLRHFTEQNLEESLDEFFDLHQRQWRYINMRGVFYDNKIKDFYKEVAHKFRLRNWLHFSHLTIDNEIVSFLYGFLHNRKLYAVTTARDIRYSKYSVGHLHAVYSIREAIKSRFTEVDFLKGDEPYKFYWTKSARKYSRVLVTENCNYSRFLFKLLGKWLRLLEIRRYSLRELYSIYKIKQTESRERMRMKLKS